MLPETKEWRSHFSSLREHRSRWRQWTLDFNHGDMDLLRARAFQSLAMEAELAGLREQVEWMHSEGMLTPAQLEAAQNCFGWGAALLTTIPEAER